MNRLMDPVELKEHIREFLKEHRQASLATCLNNIPRSSPVQYFLGLTWIYILFQPVERSLRLLQKILLFVYWLIQNILIIAGSRVYRSLERLNPVQGCFFNR